MELREYLDINGVGTEELKALANEVNAQNGSLEDLQVYDNDEYFFNEHFSTTFEAVRAVAFGSYNFSDDYIKFDGYANVETLSDWDYDKLINESKDEILDEAFNCLSESTIIDLADVDEDELEEEEEEEEEGEEEEEE